MEVSLEILPKVKTVFGISYQAGKAFHEKKQEDVVFHEVGIGIGIAVLYLIFY